jgi:hypothetical protein
MSQHPLPTTSCPDEFAYCQSFVVHDMEYLNTYVTQLEKIIFLNDLNRMNASYHCNSMVHNVVLERKEVNYGLSKLH